MGLLISSPMVSDMRASHKASQTIKLLFPTKHYFVIIVDIIDVFGIVCCM